MNYILRTSPCPGNRLISTIDSVLRSGLSTILNINLSVTQWIQETLPVYMRGLGVRIVCMLVPSALLTSAAATLSLQKAVLSDPVSDKYDLAVFFALSIWKIITIEGQSGDAIRYILRAWDTPVVKKQYTTTYCPSVTRQLGSKLLLLHMPDWLNAPPITAVGIYVYQTKLSMWQYGSDYGEPRVNLTPISVAQKLTPEGSMDFLAEKVHQGTSGMLR